MLSLVRGNVLVVKSSDSAAGAFLAGLTVPREGGLAITLTEKLEDMVTIVFLPLVRNTHRSSVRC